MMRYANKMLTEIKRKVAIRCLNFGIRNYPEFFNEKVATIANIAARNYIKREMSNQGILHCDYPQCYKRFPLRSVGEQEFCDKHFKVVSNQQEARHG